MSEETIRFLIWPSVALILVFFALLLFRKVIGAFVARSHRIRVPGVDIEAKNQQVQQEKKKDRYGA